MRLHQSTSLVLKVCSAFGVLFLLWAWNGTLDNVSTGTGKIIPSAKEQMIQSLDGGIVTALKVKEGDVVTAGQILAELDPTRAESMVAESTARLHAAQATAARLRAELRDMPLTFPPSVRANTALVRQENALYHARKAALQDTLAGYTKALSLIEHELHLTEPLVAKGAVSKVQILKLRREQNNAYNKLNDTRNHYLVEVSAALAKADIEIQTQRALVHGKSDALTRLTLKSPVDGIVNDIQITTLGGIILPHGRLMTIVPLDQHLLVETKIEPQDIAFIHTNQEALIKISAYDYSIYGGLKGQVTIVSPDTIQDNVRRDVHYYRVYIRTYSNVLKNKRGDKFPIIPGMIATVSIHTQTKTIADYLFAPFKHAREAMRER